MAYQNAVCQLVFEDKLFGTGFLFTDDQRFVLTAHHVLVELRKKDPDLSRVEARFKFRDVTQRLASVAASANVLSDTKADWAVLELASPVEIAPIPYAIPAEGVGVDAWGYPNALYAGLEIPKNAILTGDLKDVVDGRHECVLKITSGSGNCRGMSGAPVVVKGAWVGIVINAHQDPTNNMPIFGQVNVCRSDVVVAICQAPLLLAGGQYGVPPLRNIKFPKDEPFPGLVPLTDKHARMLHGRFKVLRRLLEYVRCPSQLVLVVTGRVGVGKSSLLRAGLVPHLEAEGTRVLKLERDRAVGLAQQADAINDVAGAVVFVDQVEECLAGLPGEAEGLARVLGRWSTLAQAERPRCVILGCRSDYVADLSTVMKPHCGVRVEPLLPLVRDSIIEVLCLRGDPDAPSELGIDVRYDAATAGRFADELLRDPDTTVAPLLQLRMHAMYERAKGAIKVFDAALYEQVASDLSSIEKHLDAQLNLFADHLRDHVTSGLVHDILEFHTTPQSKVQERAWSELVARYTTATRGNAYEPPVTEAVLRQLVDEMQTRKLLVDRPTDGERETSIGHDEFARLAKVVFQRSPRPGQRCRRLLEFRRDGAEAILLDADLEIVRNGIRGMRVPTDTEVDCITRSVHEQTRRHTEEAAVAARETQARDRLHNAELATTRAQLSRVRLRTRLGLALFLVIAIAGVGGFLQYRSGKQTAQADVLERAGAVQLADRNFGEAEISFAKSIVLNDSTKVRRELLQARGGTMRLMKRDTHGSSAVSADGRCVATVVTFNTIQIDDTAATPPATWQVVIEGPAPPNDESLVENMQFGPARDNAASCAGRMFAYATRGNHAVIVSRLDPGTTVGLGRLPTRAQKRISSIAIDATSTHIAIGSDDNSIGVYELVGQLRQSWFNSAAHGVAVHGVAFRPDGRVLVSGGGDYEVHLWWVADGNLVAKGVGHQDSVFGVTFSSDGSRIASGGYDRAIRLWDAKPCDGDKCASNKEPIELTTLRILQGHIGVVENLQFSTNGKMLASASKDETLRVWDVERARPVTTLTPRVGPLRSVSFTAFDAPLACGGDRGWARWVNGAHDGIEKAWIAGAPISAVTVDVNNLLAIGDADGNVFVSQLGKRFQPTQVGTVDGGINNVAFSPDGRWLVATGGAATDAHALVWSHTGTEWKQAADVKMGGAIWGATFDGSSRWLAVGGIHVGETKAEIQVWALAEAGWTLRSRTPVDHDVYSLAAIPDATHQLGGIVTSGNSNGELHAYEFPPVDPAKPLRQVRWIQNVVTGEQNVWNVAAARNRSWIVSANSDGIVRIWDPMQGDAVHGKTVALVKTPAEASINPTLDAVAYNPVNGHVAAGGDGQQVVEYALGSPTGGDLEPIQRFFGQEGTVWMVTYSPDGRYIAYGGLDGFLRIIDLQEAGRTMRVSPRTLFTESRDTTGLDVDDDLAIVLRK